MLLLFLHKQPVSLGSISSCELWTAHSWKLRRSMQYARGVQGSPTRPVAAFTHQTSYCRIKYNCKICDGEHLTVLHEHTRVLSCSVKARVGAASMSILDIEVNHGPREAITICVLYAMTSAKGPGSSSSQPPTPLQEWAVRLRLHC